MSDNRIELPNLGRTPGANSAPTVLLAEDEELLRELTSLVLRRAGYQVLEASTTNGAWEAATHSERPVEVLIADVGLAETGGVHLFQELAKSNPAMKAVFISGYPWDAIGHLVQVPQRTAFLEKPFEHAALLETLKQLLAS